MLNAFLPWLRSGSAGVTALGALGHSAEDDPALARSAAFLVAKQRLDGGWGESYLSCQDKVFFWGGGLRGGGAAFRKGGGA